MKYYLKDNKEQAFYSEGAVEIESPIRTNGKHLPLHDNISQVALDSKGNFFKYYLAEKVDGKYVPDIIKIEEEDIKDAVTSYTNKTDAHIELHVELLNKRLGVKYGSIHNAKSFALTDGYTYQADCKIITDWAFLVVWVKIREWQKTLTGIPTEGEFLLELTKCGLPAYTE